MHLHRGGVGPEAKQHRSARPGLGDRRLHWVADIAGSQPEWDAEIVDQTTDRRIAWRAIDGTPNAGALSFEPDGAGRTRIELEVDYEPHGLKQKAGDALGVVDRRIEPDLDRFKSFIESRGVETGAWRGSV